MKVSLALNLPPRPVPKEQQRHIISLKIKPPTAPSPRRHLRDQGHLPPETQQAQNRPSSSSSEETSTKGDSRKRSAHSESLPEPRKIKLHLSTRPVVSPPPTTTLPEQEFDENTPEELLFQPVLTKLILDLPRLSLSSQVSGQPALKASDVLSSWSASSEVSWSQIQTKAKNWEYRNFHEMRADMKELLDSMQKNLLLGSMASKEKENVRSTRESDNSESRMREKVAVLDELAVEFTSLLDKAMRTVHKYSEDDATSLFKYIQDGQLRASEKLVRKYPGLVHHYAKCTLAFDTSFTWGPLHVAAYLGHERLCRVFLELGANMEAQDTWNRARPLGWAAYGGHAGLCKMLVDEFKADPMAKNIHGQTALSLVEDPGHARWAGIWSAKSEAPDFKDTSNATVTANGLKVRISSSVTADSTRAPGKVLLKLPTLGRTEEEEDLDEFTQEIEDSYVVKPRRAPKPISQRNEANQKVPILSRSQSSSSAPSSRRTSPSSHKSAFIDTSPTSTLSYPNLSLRPESILQSIGIISNDDSLRRVFEIDPSCLGTTLNVGFGVHSLSVRLTLTANVPDYSVFAVAMGTVAHHPSGGSEPVKFRSSKMGQLQDAYLPLKDGLNVFEFRLLSGRLNESSTVQDRMYLEFEPGTETAQTYFLFVIR